MKKLFLFLLLAAAVFAQSPAGQQPDRNPRQPRGRRMRNIKLPQAEYDAVKAEMSDLQKAWNAGDIAALSAHMVDDVEVIDPVGNAIQGKKALDAHHTAMLKKHFAGSRATLTVRQLRFLRPRVCLCDVDVTITHYKSLPPGISVRSGQPLRMVTRYLLTKDSRDWTITAAQSTVAH